jgi:hypothetical protein
MRGSFSFVAMSYHAAFIDYKTAEHVKNLKNSLMKQYSGVFVQNDR